ncbi:DUF885 domain-containing protein [Nocardioides terrisoli]|uniref:DUF885 domain-containing protein n=1 Tax=Nocardioides terrisoli TaxID=3388267 RepID=UPI00287B9FF8|nr:DUF885 domain-containing protein [Nocardioides marmorisolisilvae]
MTDEINALAADYFEAMMVAEPTWAHLLGDYRYADRFEDATRAHEDERIAELTAFAERVRAVPEEALDADGRITRGVLLSDATTRADLASARLAEVAADPIFGPQVMVSVYAGMLGVPDAEVAEKVLTKVAAIGEHFAQLAQRQREGVDSGRVSARFAVEGTIAQIDAALVVPADQDPLVGAVQLPGDVDADRWRARAAEAVQRSLRPGMTAFRDVLRDEVSPHARSDDAAGLCHLPDGAAAYDAALRYFTTTSLSAQQIHDVGLAQIEKLAEEYRELGGSALGTSDLAEVLDRMRTDPALHFESADEMVRASEVAMRRAWEAMGDWFEVLPQAPCAVEGVTSGPKAYYFPPAKDGSRGGTFFINVDDPTSWGTFELESMAFHEGIPGHHLQLAIADELPDSVPAIRKYAETAAYAEGWGLYTERLADEMGLYSSPIDRLGMLAADSMRACRLVVDTGLHALGWSRQQAVDYMVANSPLRETMVRPEIDRYIVHPGQATSYMIGRLEIQRMRREAEARPGFDIKRFHSAVLDSGTLPLEVLDQVVRARL